MFSLGTPNSSRSLRWRGSKYALDPDAIEISKGPARWEVCGGVAYVIHLVSTGPSLEWANLLVWQALLLALAPLAESHAATDACPSPPRRRWLMAAAVLLAVLGGTAFFFGGTVIRVVTNKGELIVQVDDDRVEVVVKQNGVEVRDKTKDRTFVLTAGKGEVEFQ